MISLADAPPAPAGLLYLATFTKHERAEIAASPDLRAAIREACPAEWPEIMHRHRESRRAANRARVAALAMDGGGMRRQAIDDLKRASDALAALADNRRQQLFGTACRLAKYAAHNILSHDEIGAALREGAAANGSLERYGRRWADNSIRRALVAGRNDTLPPLDRRFRTKGVA